MIAAFSAYIPSRSIVLRWIVANNASVEPGCGRGDVMRLSWRVAFVSAVLWTVLPTVSAAESVNLFHPFSQTSQETGFIYLESDTVFFDFESSELTEPQMETLRVVAAFLTTYEIVQIRIEGNCNEREGDALNLGERRAIAARDYLVGLGIDADLISVVSNGSAQPRDPRSVDAAWAVNRSAQVVNLPIILNAP